MRVLLVCPNCRSEALVPKSQVQFGLMCPGCYKCKMRPPRKAGRRGPGGAAKPLATAGWHYLVVAGVLAAIAAVILVSAASMTISRDSKMLTGAGMGVAAGVGAVVCVVLGVNALARERDDAHDRR